MRALKALYRRRIFVDSLDEVDGPPSANKVCCDANKICCDEPLAFAAGLRPPDWRDNVCCERTWGCTLAKGASNCHPSYHSHSSLHDAGGRPLHAPAVRGQPQEFRVQPLLGARLAPAVGPPVREAVQGAASGGCAAAQEGVGGVGGEASREEEKKEEARHLQGRAGRGGLAAWRRARCAAPRSRPARRRRGGAQLPRSAAWGRHCRASGMSLSPCRGPPNHLSKRGDARCFGGDLPPGSELGRPPL